jgi:hypothetical protein
MGTISNNQKQMMSGVGCHDGSSLPAEKEELDKLLRFEARINRQLNHAIAELEPLQARRNGDSIPKQSQEAHYFQHGPGVP